jgi:hypothetical protein
MQWARRKSLDVFSANLIEIFINEHHIYVPRAEYRVILSEGEVIALLPRVPEER